MVAATTSVAHQKREAKLGIEYILVCLRFILLIPLSVRANTTFWRRSSWKLPVASQMCV
jgi:hypothetical protein